MVAAARRASPGWRRWLPAGRPQPPMTARRGQPPARASVPVGPRWSGGPRPRRRDCAEGQQGRGIGLRRWARPDGGCLLRRALRRRPGRCSRRGRGGPRGDGPGPTRVSDGSGWQRRVADREAVAGRHGGDGCRGDVRRGRRRTGRARGIVPSQRRPLDRGGKCGSVAGAYACGAAGRGTAMPITRPAGPSGSRWWPSGWTIGAGACRRRARP